MSNIIPPLLSDTPPPPPDVDDHEDDEFGDFAGTNNLSYDDDSFSLPGSPLELPSEHFQLEGSVRAEIFDINSNSKENIAEGVAQIDKSKDFCDKRKDLDSGMVGDASLASKIIANSIHDEQPISSNDPAPSLENSKVLSEESQVLNELKSNEEENEIIATNCDIKTTSSQKEISNLSFSGDEELFSRIIDSLKDVNVEDSSISEKNGCFGDFASVSVNDDSSKGANNSITHEAEAALDDDSVVIGFSEQPEEFGNNRSFEDSAQMIRTDAESIKLAEQQSNDPERHHMLANLAENCDKVQSTPQVEIGQNNEDLEISCNITCPANTSVLENEESNIGLFSKHTTDDILKQPAIENEENDFGAFVDNTRDVEVLNLANEDFGDFSTSTFNVKQSDLELDPLDGDRINNIPESNLDKGDLGGFSSTQGETSNIQQTTKKLGVKAFDDEDDDDDFSDFAVCQAGPSNNKVEKQQEFEDFATFSPLPQTNTTDQEHFGDEDDFGDFATNSLTSAEAPSGSGQFSKILLLNEKQALDKSTEIVKEMFPVVEEVACDFDYKGLEAEDKIFNQIKNVTDTHALLFQWPKSASQNLLLKALNIDSRNILYGPGWNPSMPRFAANLSFTPLEPVKSEVLTPTPARETNPSNSSQIANADGLGFGLSGMELPDPLNYLEQLVAQLQIPTSFKNPSSFHNSPSPANEFENWEAWLESIPTKVLTNSADTSDTLESASKGPDLSVKLEPTVLHDMTSRIDEKANPAIVHDDFDDFVSYSSPTVHGHSIILRETHISNKEPSKSGENGIVSWLEPTIVTPELLRRDKPFVEQEDDFDDFQMVVVSENHQISKPLDVPTTSLTVKPVEVFQLKPIIKSGTVLDVAFTKENTEFASSKPVIATDDEFGEFTFSLPKEVKRHETTTIASAPIQQPLTPVQLLEPLKPSVIPSQNQSRISWPDPGITDDEISRLEALGHSRAQNKTVSEPSEQTIIRQNEASQERKGSIGAPMFSKPSSSARPPKSNQKSLDDEEWSDFVSSQNSSSPVHKLKRTEKERSSTPDLPLSVLNLGSVQPAKQPIPVITPNGLVQTKLSSNMSLNLPNMMQQTNRVYPPQPSPLHNHPSIISNQYASQAYGGFSSYSTASKVNGDDDEWSDFVSHQASSSSPRITTSQSKPPQGWSNQPNQLLSTTPNIITNPAASFDIFNSSGGVQRQTREVSGPAQSNKGSSGISISVSMPDLDFLAPRNRTTQRK